jgi:hypothetical protein
MLYFDDRVSTLTKPGVCRCGRTAIWHVGESDPVGDEGGSFCGFCLLYDVEHSPWAKDNREEVLHVGRTCQGMAAMHNKPVPSLDDRGRLGADDAEKYAMGILYTTRTLVRRLRGTDGSR